MSTAPAIDERLHAGEITATIQAEFTTLNAAWTDNVFNVGEVPGQDGNPGVTPDLFVAIQIERRFVPNPRLVQVPSRSSWRVATICAARTVNNARLAVLAVTNALDGQRLAVGGAMSTPIYLETPSPIIPDDGMFSAEPTWTYTC